MARRCRPRIGRLLSDGPIRPHLRPRPCPEAPGLITGRQPDQLIRSRLEAASVVQLTAHPLVALQPRAGLLPQLGPSQTRRDDPVLQRYRQAATADRAAGRPMGNPAAGTVVTHLSSVRSRWVAAVPVRQDHHVHRGHQPARPAHPCPEGARHSCADRCSPTSRAVASQRGRDACHPARPEPGQPCSQQMIVIAYGDRHLQRSRESDEVQVGACSPSGVPDPWQCARRVRLSAGRAGGRPSRPKTMSRPGWRSWPTG
jgi:hypothetical protein